MLQTDWSTLGQVVYKRTYSRRDNGRSETFKETVDRMIRGNIRNHKVSQEEINRLYYYLLNRKGGPAGRGWWFSGSPAHDLMGGAALNNCFAGETEFITQEGVKKLRDCVGTTQKVLSRSQKWIDAEIKSFGQQKLFKITMHRNGVEKVVHATAEHRWFVTNRADSNRDTYEVTTSQLVPGRHRFSYTFGQGIQTSTPSPFGIAHGFCFGDGNRIQNDRAAGTLKIFGDKIEAVDRYFVQCPAYAAEGCKSYGGMPNFFKDFPSLRENKAYLLGWLMGYFAADGSVSKEGQATIASTDRKNIEFVRDLCVSIGIGVFSIQYQDRISNLTNMPSRLFSIGFMRHTLKSEFFLKKEHQRRFDSDHVKRKKNPPYWKLISVEETDRVEEVFCAVVPEEHNFTLEGNILTGNCWGITSDHWRNFVKGQDLLMCGGGVGLSVEHRFVSKLPKVKKGVVITHKATKDADFIVPDSREGWCDLFHRVLEAFFERGKGFSYSTVCVRGAGEAIKGFGGTASGPLPLINFIEKSCSVLLAREGRAMRPIDAADLFCCVGEMVVAGNVRRSAIIILGDPWDREYLRAKRWDLGGIPTQRAMANWTVVCDDVEDLTPAFWKTYEHGEPFGIFNRTVAQNQGRIGEFKKDNCVVVNPCFREDTLIHTRQGHFEIRDLVGKTVDVWDGFNWVACSNFRVTGENQPLLRITMMDGAVEHVTPYHTCILSDGSKIQAWELQIGQQLRMSELAAGKVVRTNKKGERIEILNLQPRHNDIISVEAVGIAEKVYCCTVPSTNSLTLSSGTHWGQCAEICMENFEPCNLQNIAMQNLASKDEFIEVARLMHRWGKRVTCEDYHHDQVNEVVHRNRRIGTSITGCLASPLFNPAVLDEAYAAIQKENVDYARELNVPESVRLTSVNPAGSVGKLMDCRGYEGIHAAYSRYIIQRVRFASSDPLLPMLRSAGHYMEPVQRFDGTFDHNTQVVDFYEAAPSGYPVADEDWSTWKQLEATAIAQKHWADNSVSVTVYYKREEIPKLKEWLTDNISQLKTISFLCHSEHGFKQAPKEAITKEQYERLSAKLKPIDVDQVDAGEGELSDMMGCSSGACPVK